MGLPHRALAARICLRGDNLDRPQHRGGPTICLTDFEFASRTLNTTPLLLGDRIEGGRGGWGPTDRPTPCVAGRSGNWASTAGHKRVWAFTGLRPAIRTCGR